VLDAVLLNAAAAVAAARGLTGGLVDDLAQAWEATQRAVAAGAPAGLLERWAAAAA
jgi:anthranilate phosphoribosyltransferase